jgi:hypothetical protein
MFVGYIFKVSDRRHVSYQMRDNVYDLKLPTKFHMAAQWHINSCQQTERLNKKLQKACLLMCILRKSNCRKLHGFQRLVKLSHYRPAQANGDPVG